jgi:phage shock protein E
MFQTIKNMLGMGPSVDLKQLVREGAIIVDVRTKGEYSGGHIKGSVNIPLQVLGDSLGKLKKEKTIITCCASGMRSGSAKSLLKSKGYTVHNGGGWTSLQNKLR